MPSSKPIRGPKPPELKVVFDTNALYNGSASNLVQSEIAELIKSNSAHTDLTIKWYLPSVVQQERRFQMLQKATELLPSIEKLERLLGHNLNITGDILEMRVDDAIKRAMNDMGLEIVEIDSNQVDWHRLISDSTNRRLPFEQGEKEKGFRDAIIAETFFQIVTKSPTTPKVCRIALVTRDGALAEAVKQRSSSLSNVRIITDIEELKNLINVLVSTIGEEFAQEIQEEARKYFFEQDKQDTLFNKEQIRSRIETRFAAALKEIPPGASRRQNSTWFISKPQFVKKEKQRVRWISRISIECKAYKVESIFSGQVLSSMTEPMSLGASVSPSGAPQIFYGVEPGIISKPVRVTWNLAVDVNQPFVLNQPSGKLVAEGKTIFEVVWSVSISTRKKLSAPKIEDINYIESIWQ